LLPRVDPVTHILLGASVGYGSLAHRLGRTAALAGGVAAFVPDADVFIRSATDPLLAIEHHRGFTHSLAFAPVGAAFVAGLWLARRAWRDRRWLQLWQAAVLGYLSHVLLDASTSFGTQLLWPFSRHRAGWDIVSIIDPVFTLALFVGLGWALIARQARPALVGLLVAALYLGLGIAQHARAIDAQRDLAAARGHRIQRAEAMPTMANNIIWRALYEHDGRIFSDRIRVGWFSPPTVRAGFALPLVRTADLTGSETARNARHSFERFAWFSDHWVARSPVDRSVLADMRYSLSTEAFDPIWGVRFTAPDQPTEVSWINRSRERQIKPGELWAEISGRDARFRPLP
jgi:inner membrane protein